MAALTFPLAPFRSSTANGERKGEHGVAGDKAHWKPRTQWLHGHGTFPIRKPGF